MRHITPLFRLRQRYSLLIIISFIFCSTFLLFHYNHQIQSPSPTLSNRVISKEGTALSLEQQTIIAPAPEQAKQGSWPLDEKGRSLKTHFLALDLTGFFGSSGSEGEVIRCPSSNTTFSWTRQQDRQEEVDFFVAHDAPTGQSAPFDRKVLNENKQQYSMAFIMESEVHSSTGDGWSKYDFKMSYNLDESYPEPATYFDTNSYIFDLLKPPKVSFEEKEKQADIVWIISNCNAHNGREGFIQRLMEQMKVDSYGSCLNNRQGYGARMTDNIHAYIKYKFVIAIENSNCMDYVTEKLVKAVESGSIPIVAGQNNRPDYRRYMPRHSYINIFDYPSIKALADDLKRIASNKTVYESYLWYKKHNKNLAKFKNLPLNEKIRQLKEVMGENATMFTEGIIGKERSENKMCKLIRFVRETPWKEIAEHKKTPRAGPSIACLPNRSILLHFDSKSSNSTQK